MEIIDYIHQLIWNIQILLELKMGMHFQLNLHIQQKVF